MGWSGCWEARKSTASGEKDIGREAVTVSCPCSLSLSFCEAREMSRGLIHHQLRDTLAHFMYYPDMSQISYGDHEARPPPPPLLNKYVVAEGVFPLTS